MPNLICREFKHVAPILIKNNKKELWQFVKKNNIVKIPVNLRDLRLLHEYKWKFIVLSEIYTKDVNLKKCYTCVQMTKQLIGIKKLYVQTPDGLYKKLKREKKSRV